MRSILGKVRRQLSHIPILGPVVQSLYRRYRTLGFVSSEAYWIERYSQGGNSGVGSYNKLAEQKAEVINRFIAERNITSVIEFGCGDGNQLLLANYPRYIGFDISLAALMRCRELFQEDDTKSFRQTQEYKGETAELTLSLDVIYHLVEDNVFDSYMRRLFHASTSYVIIYSSNHSHQEDGADPHVKHRKFSTWIDLHMPGWNLTQHIPNRYSPTDDPNTGSFADFYFYERAVEAN